MNLTNLDDDSIGFIMAGLRCLMQHWAEYEEYTEEHLLRMTQIYINLRKFVNKKIAEMDEEPVPETLARGPNKGEGTVLGQPDYKKKVT